MELNNFQNNGNKKKIIENEISSLDGSKKINIENETPSVEIEGLNEVNGTNWCYGNFCLLQNKKEIDDEKKIVDSRKQMITCDIKSCIKIYYGVCQMRFCHGTEDKTNLFNINSKCCLVHTNKVDYTEEKQYIIIKIN